MCRVGCDEMKHALLLIRNAPREVTRICALAVLLALFTLSLLGDTIELKTGERIEGTFKQATSAGAVIEIAGQSITIPLEKVQAIYFGAVPARQPVVGSGPADDAMDALKALQSVIDSGITYGDYSQYRDYSQRVLDARVRVDRYLSSQGSGGTELRRAIRAAMLEYELASQSWITKADPPAHGGFWKPMGDAMQDPDVAKCPTVKAAIEMNDNPPAPSSSGKRSTPVRSAPVDRSTALGLTLAIVEQSPHWSLGNTTLGILACASEQLAEAERLLTQSQPRSPSATANLTLEQVAASLANVGHPTSQQELLLQGGQASRCAVVTAPPGAEVYVDGNKAGVSPVAFVLLKQGDTPRKVTIKMTDYKTVEKAVVPGGKTIPIGLTLEKQ